MKLRVRFALIILGVVLFRFAFPGGGVPMFAFIAMIPIITISHHSKPKTALLFGLLFGTAIWSCCIWWTMPAIAKMATTSVWLLLPVFLLFCLFYALPYAAYSYAIAKYKLAMTIKGAFISTTLLTLIIFVYPHFLPGNLVHGLYQQTWFIQIAEIGGVPFLFFVVNLINGLFACTILNVKEHKQSARMSVVATLLVFSATVIYSQYKLDIIHSGLKNKSITVGVVQPNIPISWRDDEFDHQYDVYQRLADLSISLKQENPNVDVIIWPEIPTPFSYNEDEADRAFLDSLQQHLQTDIIFSSGYVYADDEHENYYNTAQLLSEGTLTSYNKQILLPFGEYLPFKETLPWLNNIFHNALNYVPGNEYKHFNLKDNIKAMPLVCYEAVFSRFVSKGIENDTDMFINLVDDAWFGDSAAAEIHFALSAFRSIEHRIPMVRVTNAGISAIIHRDGSITQMDKNLNVIRVFSEMFSI
ncbi:MAG TPA: apolipoprotein N-acyltransferase [Thiotrichaceae bacterium]|jgi:apolipoprotein N-acyltransferase|nr:apolipoprotein N-acyltransferase [Thiotrichaceae bacterium]